ncbi:MAG: T9SS type A sorting domain-containing protein [Bacteroidia bacterium]|nr:T9SS type A sorting domain-containing protein [Bacteroidia bacterium]
MLGLPFGIANDVNWYNYDGDGLPDQSGATPARADEWYWVSSGFVNVDSTGGMMSNSWTNDPAAVENWLITPSIPITDGTGSVSWSSAPRQTPRYLDGYRVLVSTTTNSLASFTDTIFTAGEYTGEQIPMLDSTFNSFIFSPVGPSVFIHGMDGNDVFYNGDSIRLVGILHTFTQSLSAYSGQTIYLAFLHLTHDDNLLILDNILVKGTGTISVNEINAEPMKLYAYPNPANKKVNLNFTLNKSSDVVIRVTDILGNEITSQSLNNISGKYSFSLNTESLSAGTYYYSVTSDSGKSNNKFVVVK